MIEAARVAVQQGYEGTMFRYSAPVMLACPEANVVTHGTPICIHWGLINTLGTLCLVLRMWCISTCTSETIHKCKLQKDPYPELRLQ